RSEEHLENLLQLFSGWEPISKFPRGVCKFHEQGDAIFNTATLAMYKAFTRGKTNIEERDFVYRINDTVITNDLIRLERAIGAFGSPAADDDPAGKVIRAIDATSVKNSLKLHESNPTYRHWLRRSLNRV